MSKRTRRPVLVAAALVTLLAIALIVMVLVAGNGDGDNEGISSAEANNSADNNGEVVEQRTASSEVTLIIVDDFGNHLGALSEKLPAENFKALANTIREIEDGKDGYTEELNALVDDLTKGLDNEPRRLLEEVIKNDADTTNCALNPEGSSFFVPDGASFFVPDGASFFVPDGAGEGGPTHGDRVLTLVKELENKYGGGLNLRIETVDTEGFDIQVIARRLRQKIVEVRRNYPDSDIVVNMSFAVVPCTTVADLAVYNRLMREFEPGLEEDLQWLQRLFAALVDSGSLSEQPVGEANFNTAFCAADEETGATALCDPKAEGVQIILVGAAGNGMFEEESGRQIGADFPFYPAAWGEVIAVSASDDTEDFLARMPRALYSNAGVVLVPGAWIASPDHTLVGTSFAAPRYSFMVALWLLGAKVDVGCGGAGIIPAPVTPYDWNRATPNPPDTPIC